MGGEGPIHTIAFSFENACFLMRFRLSSARNVRKRRWKRRLSKTGFKVETFQNASFWKRFVSIVDRWKQTFENGDVLSVTCHRFQSKSEHLSKMIDGLVMLTHVQSQVPVVFIVFEHFSVYRWKRYENASVDENILLHFRREQNGHFWKRVSVNGA